MRDLIQAVCVIPPLRHRDGFPSMFFAYVLIAATTGIHCFHLLSPPIPPTPPAIYSVQRVNDWRVSEYHQQMGITLTPFVDLTASLLDRNYYHRSYSPVSTFERSTPSRGGSGSGIQ